MGADSNLTVARASLPGSVGSVGLGVCVGSAPGKSEPGVWCRAKAAGGRSPWELGLTPLLDLSKLLQTPFCSWLLPVKYFHLEVPPRHCISTHPWTDHLHPQTCPFLRPCLTGGNPTISRARPETRELPLPSPTLLPPSPGAPGTDSSPHLHPHTHSSGSQIMGNDRQVSFPCRPAPPLGHGRSASQWTVSSWDRNCNPPFLEGVPGLRRWGSTPEPLCDLSQPLPFSVPP